MEQLHRGVWCVKCKHWHSRAALPVVWTGVRGRCHLNTTRTSRVYRHCRSCAQPVKPASSDSRLRSPRSSRQSADWPINTFGEAGVWLARPVGQLAEEAHGTC